MTKAASAYDEAMKYLNMKMYSRGDLEERLLRKKYSETDVKEALDELARIGLIDDRKYAEIYLRNLMEYKHFGYYGIRNKLLQKKLEKALVDPLLEENLTVTAEKEIAKRFVEKPVNSKRPKKSLMQALKNKGFRIEVIFDVVS